MEKVFEIGIELSQKYVSLEDIIKTGLESTKKDIAKYIAICVVIDDDDKESMRQGRNLVKILNSMAGYSKREINNEFIECMGRKVENKFKFKDLLLNYYQERTNFLNRVIAELNDTDMHFHRQ